MAERSESPTVARLVRASAAAGIAVALVAGVDAVAVLTHPLAAMMLGVDAAVGLLAAVAVQLVIALLAGSLLALCTAARDRLAGACGRRLLALAPTIALTIAVVVLNGELLARRPLPTGLLVAGLPLVHGACVLALARTGARRLAAVGAGVLVTASLLVVNGWSFRGVSAAQHHSLIGAAWAFALPTGWVLARPLAGATARAGRSGRLLLLLSWLAAVVLVVRADTSLRQAPAGARLVVRELAPATAGTLAALGGALEADGDGEPGWPAGGDCAPLDAGVSPAAAEIAGDGVDQNCLGGDADPADVAALAAQLRGSPVRPTAPPPAATRLLLVTVDALRHDAALPETWRRLEPRCTAFARAYATNSETTYAIDSLFASRFPSQGRFSAVGAFHVPVGDPAPRLPALLGAAGFATHAIAFHNRFDPRLGLTAGFDEVWTAEARPEVIFAEAGTAATDRAIARLDRRAPPWFLWVHYYDPHEPYILHDDAANPADTPFAAYLGEVAHTDRQIARLLDALGAGLDEVAVVLTADHGEAFGEHGHRFHGTDLFEEQIRVPLWVCPPRGRPLPPAAAPVSAIDIAPTLLDLAGVEAPAAFAGRSLLREAGSAPVFAEIIRGARMQAAIGVRHKLVRYLDGDVRLLFDLERDAAERVDLVGVDDVAQADLERLLDAWSALVAR